jgi:hypothetical protein
LQGEDPLKRLGLGHELGSGGGHACEEAAGEEDGGEGRLRGVGAVWLGWFHGTSDGCLLRLLRAGTPLVLLGEACDPMLENRLKNIPPLIYSAYFAILPADIRQG